MVIVMRPGANEAEINEVSKVLESLGLAYPYIKGNGKNYHWSYWG
jgi:hypothetical protein